MAIPRACYGILADKFVPKALQPSLIEHICDLNIL